MSPFLGQVQITRKPILGCRSGDSTVGCSSHYPDEEEEKPVRSAMMGQVRLSHLHRLGNTEYVCPVTAPSSYDPTLNCMRDARGNAICSDGTHYPPGCPHTPPDEYFTPGVTPDITTGTKIEGQIPTPRAAGSAAPGGSSMIVPVAIGSAGILAVVAWFALR